MVESKIEAISRISIFSGLKPSHLELLHEQARIVHHAADEHVIVMGASERDLFFLVQGRVYVTRTASSGKEVIIAQLHEGTFFGEIAALTDGDRSAFVVAASDCTVVSIPYRVLETLLREDHAFTMAFLRELAERERLASQRIADLALLDVNGRILNTLRMLSETMRAIEGFSAVVHRRPTHARLAEMVGTSREMVTRGLKRLEEDGSIRLVGTKVHLR